MYGLTLIWALAAVYGQQEAPIIRISTLVRRQPREPWNFPSHDSVDCVSCVAGRTMVVVYQPVERLSAAATQSIPAMTHVISWALLRWSPATAASS